MESIFEVDIDNLEEIKETLALIGAKVEYEDPYKGLLWKDDNENYHWTNLNGNDNIIEYLDEININTRPYFRRFKMDYEDDIFTINTLDNIYLIGSKKEGSWEEVKYIKSPVDDSYILKGKDGMLIFMDYRNEEAFDIVDYAFEIGRYGIANVRSCIPDRLLDLAFIEGEANWQGKPISKKQELKLKLLGCLDWPEYETFSACRIDTLDTEVYVAYSSSKDEYTIHCCDDKHKFYYIDEEVE